MYMFRLVYIDPPYYSPLSDNEYVRRYHFVEGLARDWQGVEIQEHTKTKKFKSYPTPFSTRSGAEEAFDNLFEKYKDSIHSRERLDMFPYTDSAKSEVDMFSRTDVLK